MLKSLIVAVIVCLGIYGVFVEMKSYERRDAILSESAYKGKVVQDMTYDSGVMGYNTLLITFTDGTELKVQSSEPIIFGK